MNRLIADTQIADAADMFKALSDPARLRTLIALAHKAQSVGELAELDGERLGTVSARLRVLLSARLVSRRRLGKQVIYSLADHHVLALIENVIDHACEAGEHHHHEPNKGHVMTNCTHPHHENHDHVHGAGCGHTAIRHEGHVDYLHDGHLHHPHGDHVDEHVIAVSDTNPDHCTPDNGCAGHDEGHIHGPGCGHEAVPHGDHIDYLVNGRLHHPHGDHCDDHGPVEIVLEHAG